MRTASFVKLLAHVLLGAGIFMAVFFLRMGTLPFWMMVLGSAACWLVLRLLAIMGQLLFEIRHDFARILTNMERSGQYANALSQEVRDLLDEKAKGQ